MYYILSLKHTAHIDKYICLWAPNNAGYVISKERAGLYPDYERGYHDVGGNMPLPAEEAEKLFTPVVYDGQNKHMILNNRENLKKLKLKREKGDLIQLT